MLSVVGPAGRPVDGGSSTPVLVGAGVGRFVLSHGGGGTDLERTRTLVRSYDAEILVAGGVNDLDALRQLRDAGVTGVILGQALLSGAIDYPAAMEAAA